MKTKFTIITLLFLFTIHHLFAQTPSEQFSKEMKELKEFFQIPGMAILVEKEGEIIHEEYLGYADLESQLTVDAKTVFPIASLTKIFSAVLVMKLVEEGKLSLEEPIKNYFPEIEIREDILIKHILSHTSQGSEIGKYFYYSARFGLLTQVIEQASGKTFEEAMEEYIFRPLNLQNTFLLGSLGQLDRENLSFAQPYLLEEGIQEGFVDEGFSTSAGMVSNAEDLLILSQALDNNLLISETSKNTMYQPLKEDLPYAFGVFQQEFLGENLLWAYGQYDCYSSLFLKIANENLTLILLANNNLMSDPARLIYGDVTQSLFALSFLKNFAFEDQETALTLLESNQLGSLNAQGEFHREKLLAEALAASFMARFGGNHFQNSISLLEKVFEFYPNYENYGDLSLLHNLMFLKDVAFYMELGDFTQFEEQTEKLALTLYEKDPENPYINGYLGSFYHYKGQPEKARSYYEAIVNASNFSTNWYTQEAQAWLEEH